MALDNGGTINNTSNPTGHSHSIHQITELSAGGVTGDMLVCSNDIWIPHEATPYVVASGIYIHQDPIASIPANGNTALIEINYETFFGIPTKFKFTPILTVSLAFNFANQEFLTVRTSSASTTGFFFTLYNPRAVASGAIAANAVRLQFHAVQMFSNAAGGMVSRDPSI